MTFERDLIARQCRWHDLAPRRVHAEQRTPALEFDRHRALHVHDDHLVLTPARECIGQHVEPEEMVRMIVCDHDRFESLAAVEYLRDDAMRPLARMARPRAPRLRL
jgi:hypothetical protein